MANQNPNKLEALNAHIAAAVANGRYAEAAEGFESWLQDKDGRSNKTVWVRYAGVLRALSRHGDALAALDQAINLDPRFFLAHLMKGSILDKAGDLHAASKEYEIALTVAPNEQQLDPHTFGAFVRAREVTHARRKQIREYVLAETELNARGTVEEKRARLFLDMVLGLERNYRQEPTDFFYPGLPAIGFYERSHFPWLQELEAQTARIKEELLSVLPREEAFVPYMNYGDGIPLDQWQDLNRSRRWSAYHFYHYGRRYEENCERCPQTMNALALAPQPQVIGKMPAAMYSVLRPRTRIPPHTGVANVRLVCHLALIVPPDCGFRVGQETRSWEEGKAWVFDDTIEHEAWNNSDQDRVVFIFDVWNPLLTSVERDLISRVLGAMDQFDARSSNFNL